MVNQRCVSVQVTEPIPPSCTPNDFVLSSDMIYETNGTSNALNQYSLQQNKSYKLTISKTVINAVDTGQTTKPGDRSLADIVEGWQMGIEQQRSYCNVSGTWYWVTRSAVLEDITPPQVGCTIASFTMGSDAIYETGGTSSALNQLSVNAGKNYRLTILKNAIAARDTNNSVMPSERSFADIVDGWQTGMEETREFCQESGTWYWVTRTAILEEIVSGCVANADCPIGYTCVNGTCEPIEEKKDNTAVYVGATILTLGLAYAISKKGEKD